MKPVVSISLGGSVINPGEIDTQFLQNFTDVIKGYLRQSKFVVVCGGGKIARQYIAGLPSGLTEGERDTMAIAATWLNARLLSFYFRGYCSLMLPTTIIELTEQLQTYDVGLAGGFLPAVKTDEDAAVLADLVGSRVLINVTNVDGIYDKDPRESDDAQKYETLTYKEFYEIVSPLSLGAGSNAPFTLIASKICERTNIRVVICPKDIEKIRLAIQGKNVGTVIQNPEAK